MSFSKRDANSAVGGVEELRDAYQDAVDDLEQANDAIGVLKGEIESLKDELAEANKQTEQT